jgi:hypothetical protein
MVGIRNSATNWAAGTTALSRLSPELSKRARQRLQWMDHFEKHGSVSLTCRYFGIRQADVLPGARALRRGASFVTRRSLEQTPPRAEAHVVA